MCFMMQAHQVVDVQAFAPVILQWNDVVDCVGWHHPALCHVQIYIYLVQVKDTLPYPPPLCRVIERGRSAVTLVLVIQAVTLAAPDLPAWAYSSLRDLPSAAGT